MAISQHSEAVGEPTQFSLINASVSIHCSDAKHRDRPPRPHFDPSLPEGYINYLEDADELAVKRWKRDIGTYLVHEMNLQPKARAGTQYVLSKFPSNYRLYVHLKGKKDDPRRDYYLCGSRWVRKFRSPEEFVLHAKWLAFDAPLGQDGKPLCACKYCGKNDQSKISEYLSDKVGYEDTHFGASRPMKKGRRAEPDKPIMFKDYTRLRDATQFDEIKPDLHQIKDEEF